ncbi:MAG: hypothetical protein AAF587_15700 [Bacteroidota bacterium]
MMIAPYKAAFSPYLCCLTLLILGISSIAQPDYEWKKVHDLGNRYEGTFSQKVGTEVLELVSIYTYFSSYDMRPESKDRLFVHFYLDKAYPVSIRAFEKEPKKYYWMEAKDIKTHPGWNVFGPWPVDSLVSLNISHEDVGVVIRLKNGNNNLFIPAHVSLSKHRQAISESCIGLVLKEELERGIVNFYQGIRFRSELSPTRSDPPNLYRLSHHPAGRVFNLCVEPKKYPGLTNGWITVHMRLRITNKTKPELYTFSYLHPA